MKKVIVCCNAGVSTSLLVNKLQNAAKEQGTDYEIEAYPLAKAIDHLADADAVLLSPQVGFAQPNLQDGTSAPVRTIDVNDYANADVAAILTEIKELLG